MGEAKLRADKIFWFTLICGGFFLSITLWFSFTLDQALCNYVAWIWKHYHLPPYFGVWDLSFPGIFFLHRAVMEIFGESIFGFRLFDFLVQLFNLALLYYLARVLSGSRGAGFFAGVFYSIYYANLGSLETGEREGYVLFLLLLSLVLSLRFKDRAWLRGGLTGLLLGFAFLLKPTYVLCWAVFGAWFLWEGIHSGKKRVIIELAFYAFFCLVPLGLVVWYYWHLGYLRELYQATVLYNLEVYGRSGSASPFILKGGKLVLLVLHENFLEESLLIFSGLMMILVSLVNPAQRKEKNLFWMLFALLIISAFSYWVQAKYFFYHLIPFMGFMMIFSGWFFSFLGEGLKREGKYEWIWSGVFYLFLLVLMIFGINTEMVRFFGSNYFKPLERAYSTGSGYDAQYYREAKALAPLLRGEEEIGYFGWHPLVPYLLQKKLPSRFCMVYQFLMRDEKGELSPLQREWIKEYTEAMIKARPHFFLMADYVPGWDLYNLKSPSLKQALQEEFPELNAFLKENYKLYRSGPLLDIYVFFGQ